MTQESHTFTLEYDTVRWDQNLLSSSLIDTSQQVANKAEVFIFKPIYRYTYNGENKSRFHSEFVGHYFVWGMGRRCQQASSSKGKTLSDFLVYKIHEIYTKWEIELSECGKLLRKKDNIELGVANVNCWYIVLRNERRERKNFASFQDFLYDLHLYQRSEIPREMTVSDWLAICVAFGILLGSVKLKEVFETRPKLT